MKIVTAGDSFTYGEELSDINSAWPYLLAKRCNASVDNLAKPASSNDRIFRLLFEYLIDSPKPDLVVIGWTSPGRLEFADDIGTYDIWPGYSGNLFLKDGCAWRLELANYISQYHNSEYLYKKFLQIVITTQSFLQSQNINYIMCNTLQNEYYKSQILKTPNRSCYFAQIDKNKFVGFDQAGMLEWTHGCKKGPNGHFLEQGHEKVADKIYEHTRNLGWLS